MNVDQSRTVHVLSTLQNTSSCSWRPKMSAERRSHPDSPRLTVQQTLPNVHSVPEDVVQTQTKPKTPPAPPCPGPAHAVHASVLVQRTPLRVQSFCLSKLKNKKTKTLSLIDLRAFLSPPLSLFIYIYLSRARACTCALFTPSSGPAWTRLSPSLWTAPSPSSRPLRSWNSCGRQCQHPRTAARPA